MNVFNCHSLVNIILLLVNAHSFHPICQCMNARSTACPRRDLQLQLHMRLMTQLINRETTNWSEPISSASIKRSSTAVQSSKLKVCSHVPFAPSRLPTETFHYYSQNVPVDGSLLWYMLWYKYFHRLYTASDTRSTDCSKYQRLGEENQSPLEVALVLDSWTRL